MSPIRPLIALILKSFAIIVPNDREPARFNVTVYRERDCGIHRSGASMWTKYRSRATVEMVSRSNDERRMYICIVASSRLPFNLTRYFSHLRTKRGGVMREKERRIVKRRGRANTERDNGWNIVKGKRERGAHTRWRAFISVQL